MTEKDDGFGTVLREKMKESMAKPAGKWSPTPSPRPRQKWPLVGFGLCLIAAALFFALTWLALDWIESSFR